jgi:hypothetical protein
MVKWIIIWDNSSKVDNACDMDNHGEWPPSWSTWQHFFFLAQNIIQRLLRFGHDALGGNWYVDMFHLITKIEINLGLSTSLAYRL